MKNNKLFVFILLCIFATGANAEYYISDGCGGSTCSAPAPTCERTYKKHKRHYVAKRHYKKVYTAQRYKRNSYRVSVYYYYPQPVCGCASRYVPASYSCGRCNPGHWVSERRMYVKYRGPYMVDSFSDTWYSPVNDRATADDYYSEMQIN